MRRDGMGWLCVSSGCGLSAVCYCGSPSSLFGNYRFEQKGWDLRCIHIFTEMCYTSVQSDSRLLLRISPEFVSLFLSHFFCSHGRSTLLLLVAIKDVGCRSNFDRSRPLYTQDTSFSVKSSLMAVCQGVQTLSTDIFGCHHRLFLLARQPGVSWAHSVPRVLRAFRAPPEAARASLHRRSRDPGAAPARPRNGGGSEAGLPEHPGGVLAQQILPDRAHEG